MDLVQPQLRSHRLAHSGGVAGEHDGLSYTGGLQVPDGLGSVRLHLVGDDDVTQIGALGGHVDRGAHLVAGVPGDAELIHQLSIAHPDGYAVHLGLNALARALLHAGHPAPVQLHAPGLPDGAGNGVVGVGLGQGGQLQQMLFGALVGVDGGDVEHTLCQSAGLVKDHNFRVGQGLQVVAALD